MNNIYLIDSYQAHLPSNALRTSNSFARSDNSVVIDSEPNPSLLFAPSSWLFLFSVLHLDKTQSLTCLATDASLTADPGVASSIPARSHTFVEIDHEIISTVILLPSAESFKKGCCQLQAKVCAQNTG